MTTKYLKKLEILVNEWNDFAVMSKPSIASLTFMRTYITDALLNGDTESLDRSKIILNPENNLKLKRRR